MLELQKQIRHKVLQGDAACIKRLMISVPQIRLMIEMGVESVNAKTLARKMKLPVMSISNKLAALADAGYIIKTRVAHSTRNGAVYEYQVTPETAGDLL